MEVEKVNVFGMVIFEDFLTVLLEAMTCKTTDIITSQ